MATTAKVRGFIVRSALNPALVLRQSGEFLSYQFDCLGLFLKGDKIKIYKTHRAAERVRGGYGILIHEVAL